MLMGIPLPLPNRAASIESGPWFFVQALNSCNPGDPERTARATDEERGGIRPVRTSRFTKPMSEIQGIVAIVVPALVAGASVLSAHRISRRALDHQRHLSDLDAARSLLDQGAELLRQSSEVVLALDDGFTKYGQAMFAIPGMPETYDALDQIADDLGALSMRVNVRLGPAHPTGLALELICAAVDQFRRILRIGRIGLATTTERSAEDQRQMASARRMYFGESATYIASAHRTVGAELPGVDLTIFGDQWESPKKPPLRRRLRWELVDGLAKLPIPVSAIRRIEGLP
ncbi:MAG TPA: hypothetical protein VFX45_10960 [Solirubrobacterales bacterium]|nr:hypothetical protein [Solirubrobacterales bacterium]